MVYRRRRYAPKKKAPMRRRARYYKRAAARGGRNGGMFVVRKVQSLVTTNTLGTVGGYNPNVSNNSITLGTPAASPLGGNLYDVPFSIQCRLDELVNNSEFANLFDRYKITSCKVKIQAAFFSSTQTSTPVPWIEYVTDHDDATPPSISDMRQKMGTKTKYFGPKSTITMGVKPVPAQLIYNSGAFNAYGVPKRAPFINMTNTGVPHYGIKGVIHSLFLPATVGASPLTWDLSYGVALRDVQ